MPCKHGHPPNNPPSKWGCRECDRLKKRRRRGPAISVEERFSKKVRKSDGCWEWSGYKNSKGYGRVTVARIVRYAHRVAWELANGAIPDGLYVCHSCDNPGCVRPDHLFLATNDENMADMVAKGRARNGAMARRADL